MSARDELMDYVRELVHERRAKGAEPPLTLTDVQWSVDQLKFALQEHGKAIESLDKRVRELEDGRVVLLEKIMQTLAEMG